MICRHKEWKDIDETHKECLECGAWKGARGDAHFYTKEYYFTPAFGLFRAGIPQRTAVYAGYQFQHFKPLGIEFTKPSKILEIGCGVGLVSYGLYLDGHDVTVVEQAEWPTKWMEEAFGQHKRFRIEKANFENMDRSKLGTGFDFIFANHVWEHLDDPMECLEWCFENLASGGKIFFNLPDKEMEKAMHHTHCWAYNKENMELWFKQAGLVDIKSMAYSGGPEQSVGGNFFRIVGAKP